MPEGSLGAGDRVVIAGSSGLIGTALGASLRSRGVDVIRLVRRRPTASDEREWDPTGPLDPQILDGARAVVILNGASIGHLPWTRTYRAELLWSRLTPVRTIANAVRVLGDPAPQLVMASAVGYYGTAPGRRVTEHGTAGSGFLPSLCRTIEDAARTAEDVTTVTRLRLAPVIHADGVLRPLMALTRFGLSGPLGSGTQQWPWISLPDAVDAIEHVIAHRIGGAVNLTGPTPACANDIGFALAVKMQRPYLFRAPAWALRTILGPAADGLLLSDLDVVPAVLEQTGFTWRHPTAEDAIAAAVPAGSTISAAKRPPR